MKEPKIRRAFRQALVRWFKRDGRDLPWRRTRDPYAILVSEFMLQQTQVSTVLAYYHRWLERFPGMASLSAAPLDEVLRVWEGLGYYARAKNLHRAAQAVMSRDGAVFPRDLENIRALPGVGRYTAGAVATFAFDAATPIVDANIARVLARVINLTIPIDTVEGKRILWETAESLVPARGARIYNSAVMELGALICRSRAPLCLACPIVKFCGAAAAASQQAVPVKKKGRATITLNEDCCWICTVDGGALLEREEGSRWSGLWKLPRLTEPVSPKAVPLLELNYSFTHHAVTLRVHPAAAPVAHRASQAWFRLDELESVAMASAHRRAVRELTSRMRVEG